MNLLTKTSIGAALAYVSLLSLLGCDEDKSIDAVTAEGTLAWYGDPAVDGCGLVLEVDTSIYRASSMKNAYINFSERDSNRIDVVARYVVTGELDNTRGCHPTPIRILMINRK